jgi:hypothetical protein
MVHCFLTFHRSLDATEGTKTEASIDPPFDSRVSGPRDRLNETSLSGHLRRFLACYHSAAVIALWRKTHEKHCHARTGGSIITTASMQAYDPSPNLLPYATTNSPGIAFARPYRGASLEGERLNRILTRSFEPCLKQSPHDFSLEKPIEILAIPARHFWDAKYLRANHPTSSLPMTAQALRKVILFGRVMRTRPGNSCTATRSAWLPASLLEADRQNALSEALVAATRHWGVSLHFNKGFAGAPNYCLAEAKETAMNPVALDAFALAITASHGPPAFQYIAGHEPDLTKARGEASAVRAAMAELLKIVPNAGSYLAESDYFQREWQHSFWGANYERLAAIKQK